MDEVRESERESERMDPWRRETMETESRRDVRLSYRGGGGDNPTGFK